MEQWAPIKYREFYDVPRIFLVETGNELFLFDCPFNSDKDEYQTTYKIYLMPEINEKELAGSWEHLPARATRLVGELPISELEFDSTLRQRVNLAAMSRFGY